MLLFFLLLDLVSGQKVAIIGQGISGSFTAKYLADYDQKCKLDSITIFEAVPIEGPLSVQDLPNHNNNNDDDDDNDWQGSRVTSVRLDNGVNIELGASIGHQDFHLVLDMIRNDPSMELGPPFDPGSLNDDDHEQERSMGIYMGNQTWAFRTWSGWKLWNKVALIVRYNFDLLKLSKLLRQTLKSFGMLPQLLHSTEPGTFFESPDEIWDRLGFLPAVHAPFSVLLDAAKISKRGGGGQLSAWRKFFPFQGSLRDEMLTAINLVNYNQNIDQINGLVGLGSFAAASGNLFSIKGGNHAVIRSAIQQAKNTRSKLSCFGQIRQEPKRVTHIVGSLNGLHLFSESQDLGIFDAVVLAAPLHQARIEFKVQSQFDPTVLQPMPLGGLIETDDEEQNTTHPEHEGHEAYPDYLPESAHRPYTQVVTTVVSHAELQGERLGLDHEKPPRSILFTESGKASLYNITAITRIHPSGVYKLFSNDILSDEVKMELFGPSVLTEYTKMWGGPHGGATPDYQGGGQSTSFLLYDAAVGLEGHTKVGALYYPQAVELSTLACMEISAIGAKAVAKLMAKRFGWIHEDEIENAHDEL